MSEETAESVDDATDEDATAESVDEEPEPEQAAESVDEADADAEAGVDEPEEDEPEEDEPEEGGIEEGDFVRLDYTVRTVEDGTVIDTTRKDVAEEAGIDDEDYEFEPRVVVVGAGHVFQGVDEALTGQHPGDEGTVTIPAEEAFGEVDPENVRTVSADRIDEDDRYPGAQVQIDGEQGRLETIIGKRARVDFNHPLAGEALEYEYEVVDVVEDRVERAEGLLGMYLQQTPEMWIRTDEVEQERTVEVEPDEEDADDGAEGDEETGADEGAADDEADEEEPEPEFETVTETVEKETLYVEATPQMTMNQQWLFSKQQIAQDLMNRLGLDRVIVQETIESPGMGMGMGGMMGGMGGGAVPPVGDDEGEGEVDIDPEELVEELETEE
jgi:FKBP-type peptidyl-prolyl cis-trans isomerase SlyD